MLCPEDALLRHKSFRYDAFICDHLRCPASMCTSERRSDGEIAKSKNRRNFPMLVTKFPCQLSQVHCP